MQLVLVVSGRSGVGRQIANAQIIFNLIGTAVVILVLPVIARLLERLIPDALSDRQLQPDIVSQT